RRAQALDGRRRGAREAQRRAQEALRGIFWRVETSGHMSLPVWLVTALLVALMMLLPLGWIVALRLGGERGAGLPSYRAAVGGLGSQGALWNAVVLAFWVGVGSLAVGAPMAWLTARTDLPAKRAIRALMLASFVTPPFLGAFAWVMLAGPNAGILNKLYRAL